MNPTSPDRPGSEGPGLTRREDPRPRPEPPTVDFPPRHDTTVPEHLDEAVGEQLDRHLESLCAGTPSPTGDPTLAPHLDQLQPVVDQLHALFQYLAFPGEGESTTDRPETEDTGNSPARVESTRSGASIQPPAAEKDTPDNERVGKYCLVRKLGGGGQAGAYLAFDPDLHRHVVIKLYHEAHTPREQETILREGQALARVRSPYVAQCFSAERHEGVPYLVVEYIPGKNLAEQQRQRPLPLGRAVELVCQVAEGLAAVHACGLLHRDIKPANILVGDDGLPRLVDFGLAVPLAGEGLRGVSGTLSYMAPEQARGEAERIDARSDLFGLGAVLYDLLTGRPPYQAASQEALWNAARDGDVAPPREHNPGLPASMNDLCMRCLAKDPGQRFASAAELVQALRRWQRRRRWLGQDLAERLGRGKFRLLVAAAAAALVLLPVGLYFLFANWDTAPDRPGTQARRDEANPPLAKGARDQAEPFPRKFPLPRLNAQGGDNPRPHGRMVLAEPKPPDGRKLRHDFTVKVDLLRKRAAQPRTFRNWPADNQGVYRLDDGQRVWIRIRVARSSYVGIWYVDEKKQYIQLFPNNFETDNRLPGGQALIIPGEEQDDDYALETDPTQGIEHLYVLATTQSWKPPPALRGVGKDDVYAVVEGQDVANLSRGIKAKALREVSVAEVIVPFRVDGAARK